MFIVRFWKVGPTENISVLIHARMHVPNIRYLQRGVEPKMTMSNSLIWITVLEQFLCTASGYNEQYSHRPLIDDLLEN